MATTPKASAIEHLRLIVDSLKAAQPAKPTSTDADPSPPAISDQSAPSTATPDAPQPEPTEPPPLVPEASSETSPPKQSYVPSPAVESSEPAATATEEHSIQYDDEVKEVNALIDCIQKEVFSFRLRPSPTALPWRRENRVWTFIEETLQKSSHKARAQEVLETVKSSGSSRDPDILFIKYCLMQQTLPFWIDVLRQDKAAVAAFYEPGALFRDDVKMELVVAELRALEGARHFQFDFKTNVSAIASLYAATTSSAAAAFPSVAVSASSFVENAFGFGRSAFTAASAAARGGIENVKKNSESLLTVASSSLGSSPTAEPGKSRPASGGTAREVEKEGQVPDLDSFRELYEKEKKERLALQVELVSVKHSRDVEVSTLKAQNISLAKTVSNLKAEIQALREELAESIRAQASNGPAA